MNWSLGPISRVQKPNEHHSLDPRRVRLARDGDSAAFHQIYDTCAPAVHALLLAHAPLDAVEDLMQETFCSAWLDLPKLKDEERFQAWLMGIARNKVRRFFRQRKRDAFLSLDEETQLPAAWAFSASKSEAAFAAKEGAVASRNEVLLAIRSFSPRERELLMLRLMEEWSSVQIAASLNLRAQSVKVQLSRALAKLRGRLEGRLNHD